MKHALVIVVAVSCRGDAGTSREDPAPPAQPIVQPVATTPSPPAAPAPAAAPALGCFDDARRIAVDGAIVDLAAADVDGDGAVDVVALYSGATPADADDHSYAIVLRGDGHGGLAPGARWEIESSALTLAIGDFDGDGKLDLVTTSAPFDGTQRTSIQLYAGRGDGTFASGVKRTLPMSVAESIVDLDGDGRGEIVVTASHAVEIYAAKPLGRGAQIASGKYPHSVIAVDLDGDRLPDLVFVDNNDVLRVVKNRGRGAFAAPSSVATCVAPRAVRVTDWDGDGKLDALVACAGSKYVGKAAEAPTLLGLVSDVGGAHPALATLADVPAEELALAGDVLLAAGNVGYPEPQTVVTAIGKGGKTLGAITIDGQIRHLRAIDLDGDGRLDVIASRWTGHAPGDVIVWHARACSR